MDRDDIHSLSWKGWAELENDPAIFSTLLREWGVPNVSVNEVVPIDSIFETPSDVVFGLIFLSRWTIANSENETIEVPTDVWFANQVGWPLECILGNADYSRHPPSPVRLSRS